MISVENIEDSNRFGMIAGEWNDLLDASDSDCLFLTWEWLHTWWKHLSEDRRLHILTVRRDGVLVAIAPLSVRSRRWRRLLPFPALEFLGTGSVGSDYLDVFLRRGEEGDALTALARHLDARRQVLEMSRVRHAAAQAGHLAAEIARRGWVANRVATDVCPYVDLTGHDWSSFLASLGSAHRYNVRRRLRNLQKHWAVRFEQVRSEAERAAAMQSLVALHARRWRQRGRPGAFHSDALIAFHDELTRLALAAGWLRLYVLRLDGQPAAALYGFLYHGVFYFYQSGFDPAFGRYSVGLVMTSLAIKHAIEEGATRYDFLRGDEPYKFLWARTQCRLVRLELYPPDEHGALCRQVADLRDGVKRMALMLNFPGVS